MARATAGRGDRHVRHTVLDERFWANATRSRDRALGRSAKQSTTVRLYADVLQWLKAKGKGYQTRLNAILREAMMRQG